MQVKNWPTRSKERTDRQTVRRWGVAPELEKAQPEIKETKPAADKQQDAAKRQQKRKPFDTGKMIALLRAGWNVPKIADEMGVSEPTIYNHMKKEGITK